MADQNSFERKAYEDYTQFKDDTADWRRETDKMRKYYFGQQYSSAMSDKYAARGWSDLVINKIRPLIKSRISRMIAGKPQGKVFGYKAADMTTAYALNEFLDYHYYNSDGAFQFEDAATYQLREGVGYLIVTRDWDSDYGRGELKIIAESFENIFTRKSARSWDFKDGGRIIHSRLTDKSDIEYRLNDWLGGVDLNSFLHPFDIPEFDGKKKDQKKDSVGLPRVLSGGNRYIREFDVYDLVKKEVRAIHYIPTNTVIVVDDNYKVNNEENKLIKDGLIRFDKFMVPRVQYTKFIGNGSNSKRIGDQEILPIEFFPVVPLHNERTGNSCSLGETHFFYGMQEMLNQSAALMVMHAALASLFKVIVDTRKYKGDLDTFKEEWAALGAIVGLEADPETGKFPIEIIRPEPINQAFWSMTQYFGSELEYQSMSSSTSWGASGKYTPESAPPLLLLNEWNDNSLRLHLNHFELGIERLYTVLLQWSKGFYGFKTFPVKRNEMEVENFVNSKIPLDTGIVDKNGMPIMSTNNIKDLKTRFRIKLGSTAPAPTQQYLQIFQQMAQQYPVFLKFMIKYMDIEPSEKAELMESVDILKQQQVQMQQLEGSLQAVSKALKTEMAKNIEMEKGHKVDQASIRLEKILMKEKADAKIRSVENKNKPNEG